MTDSAPGGAAKQSTVIDWLKLLAGLAATFSWVRFSQSVEATITVEDPAAALAVFYGLLFAPLILLALVLGYLEHRSVVRIGERPGRWLLIGLLTGTGGLLITIGYAWLNGEIVAGAVASAEMMAILLGMALTLVQTGTEELLFRGWLQPVLVERLGALAGVTLGAILFTGFHLTAGVRAPLSLINVTLAGALFGLLALRSGGIVASITAHFAWNAIEDLVLGLVPNPGNGALGSLLDYDLLGGALWGGQEEGLNASIGTTVVLLALILPLLRPGQTLVASEEQTEQVPTS